MTQFVPILQNTPLFTGLTTDEILTVLHCAHAFVLNKRRDTYILRTGDTTDTMGLILSGSALIIQEDIWGHRNLLTFSHRFL